MAKYVMKFGGTSLKNATAIERARRIVQSFYEEKKPEQLIVVVSAQGKLDDSPLGDKVTNLLERVYKENNCEDIRQEIARRTYQTCKELGISRPSELIERFLVARCPYDDKSYSQIVSFGERISANMVGKYFAKFMNAQTLGFDEIGLVTEGENYKDANILECALPTIKKTLEQRAKVLVIPGFLGYNFRGEVTTLGRDGSNYSATTIGRAINAAGVYIFSDEPGVRRASPSHVNDAEVLKQITYEEAIEFAELGAKIINAKSVIPARDGNIPIHIVDETYEGTQISSTVDKKHQGAKIIASSPGYYLLNLHYDEDKPGVLAEIAEVFKNTGINIGSISDERHSLSIAFVPNDQSKVEDLKNILGEKYRCDIENTYSRISVIGEGMRGQTGLLSRVASCFARNNISVDMISQGLNQLNITMFIPQQHEQIAVRSLYEELFRR